MIQLGFASAILPDLSLVDVMTFAAETGFDCVEVMCWPLSKAERRYAGITHIDIATLDDARVGEINRLIEQTGVAISALGYYPNCLSPDEEESRRSCEPARPLATPRAEVGWPAPPASA